MGKFLARERFFRYFLGNEFVEDVSLVCTSSQAFAVSLPLVGNILQQLVKFTQCCAVVTVCKQLKFRPIMTTSG